MKTKPRKSIKKRKAPIDEPLSRHMWARIRALQAFGRRIDAAAEEALNHGYLCGAGGFIYSMDDALEDLAKSTEYPIANGIFEAAKGALAYAVTKTQEESKLYKNGGGGTRFINWGPSVGDRLTEAEKDKAMRDWLARFAPGAARVRRAAPVGGEADGDAGHRN